MNETGETSGIGPNTAACKSIPGVSNGRSDGQGAVTESHAGM